MTPQDELTMLETAYATIITGGVQSYAINGRQLTRLDIQFITRRMDELRAIIYRQTNGMFQAAQNRPQE